MVEGGGGPRGVQEGYILDWGRVSPKKKFSKFISFNILTTPPVLMKPAPYVRPSVSQCTLKTRVRVEIFKDETDLTFMQIVTQNDEIEVTFMHITIPSLHL